MAEHAVQVRCIRTLPADPDASALSATHVCQVMAALTGFPRMHANAPSSSGFVRVGTLGGRYVL